MGSALAKNYDVEKEATCSGGHCYLWQVFKATRKKDGKKVSVFYFNKADFEKRERADWNCSASFRALLAAPPPLFAPRPILSHDRVPWKR